MLDIIVCKDIENLSKRASDFFLKIHHSIKSHDRFYIIPGGNTPRKFYSLLAYKVDNWFNTKLLLSDERMVPSNDSNSNFLMVNNELIFKINKLNKPSLINYFISGLNNNDIISYLENYIFRFNNPNLAILGFGDDGHTASLFPGSLSSFDNNNRTFIEEKNDNEPFIRISLTFKILMNANQIMFLISGKKKAHALKMCLEGNYNPTKYPAQYLFRNYKNNITVFCDKNAVTELGDIVD